MPCCPQVIKEKDLLRAELDKSKAQIKEADAAISSQKAEIDKLNHIINEADQERIRQKKEYDIVVNERDILGTQLVRRNDELALLYEKIKIQQSTLAKGQIQYRDRLNEIRVLKVKLADLKRELHILKSSVSNIDVLKREVHQLGRELLQVRWGRRVEACGRIGAWADSGSTGQGALGMGQGTSAVAWKWGVQRAACCMHMCGMGSCAYALAHHACVFLPHVQERTKVKALSEELENPLNVHRWRKLEGSDPGTYEMIQKIQTLQKRLISKTEEVVEKDLLIQVRTHSSALACVRRALPSLPVRLP